MQCWVSVGPRWSNIDPELVPFPLLRCCITAVSVPLAAAAIRCDSSPAGQAGF